MLDKKTNTNFSMEEIEQRFWKGDLNENVDEYFERISKMLDNAGITPKNISDTYSLARSGKQMKIEVIAQVSWMIIAHFD